ncbi:MAG: thiamine pyrophosphate-dependent dehydrogenase E1 component subunit alpha [Nitrospinota bacterium]|nr:thiamine pyrophosphate-dependent dehydrogenase E1 component subunit alpha [Nitrospinota bacterium]
MIRYPYNELEFTFSSSPDETYEADFLIGLYRSMLRIRMIQEAIESRYHEDEMKTPIHLVIGQEATSVGVCAALRTTDQVYSSHRTQGNYLAKGGSLKGMMSELYCRLNGCAGSRGGSMHLLDKSVGYAGSSAIVGGSVPIATGAAFGAQYLKKDQINVVFFGDAATEEGAIWESINFAALKSLPVLYICENNFYSVCSSMEVRQPKVDIYKKAGAFGVNSCRIDGTQVLNVYEATREAVKIARSGGGPTFIESVAYRWRGHGGAGDDSASGYRDPEEVKAWQKFCPIDGLYKDLMKKNLFDETRNSSMKKEIQDEIEEAFQHAINSPNPEEKDLSTYVYSD